MAQTKTAIRALLTAAGINPLKRYGQHFLIDGNLLRKLVAAAGVTRADAVLEIGPGTGTLTEELLAVAGHVVAVEIDKGLAGICRARFGDSPRFTLIHRDVLERKGKIAPEVLAELGRRRDGLNSRGGQDARPPVGRAMLVANLPYQVATSLVIELMMGDERVSPLCFTVQREVADRLAARPGGKDYGPISVFAQALGEVARIARVAAEAFWPVPEVESTMLRIDAREDGPGPRVRRELGRLVHGCFNHRRKTMRYNLRELLSDVQYQQVEAAGRWELGDRPERVTVEEWVEMARLISNE